MNTLVNCVDVQLKFNINNFIFGPLTDHPVTQLHKTDDPKSGGMSKKVR